MTLAIAAMVGVFTACENTPNTPVGPGIGGEEGGEVTGPGSKDKPYTVDEVITLDNAQKGPFFVKGYIVGQIGGKSLDSNSEFAAPWTTFINTTTGQATTYNTNLLIAANADETNVNNVVPVQLPSGALRNALNLPENPNMHKKEILIYGSLESYFNVPGIKYPTYAVVDGTEYGSEPVVVDPNEQIYAESFAEGQGDFTIVDVKITEPLTYVWSHDTKYKYMKASSYKKDATYEAESWLISPAIDLTGKSNVNLTFEHAIGPNVDVDKNTMTVWFSSDYKEGQPSGANWTQANVTEWSAAKWNFVNVTLPVPAEMQGKANIRFAFKYATTTDGSTWEIKNLYVK